MQKKVKRKVIRKNLGIQHRIADCEQCNWREEGYEDAHILARKHTKETGHNTHVEEGRLIKFRSYLYNER